jgi:hypothetical protein
MARLVIGTVVTNGWAKRNVSPSLDVLPEGVLANLSIVLNLRFREYVKNLQYYKNAGCGTERSNGCREKIKAEQT